MNTEQQILYNEWKDLEKKSHWSAGTIQYSDIKRVEEIRPRIWKELRGFLTAAERLDLGKNLGKKPSESLDRQWPPRNWAEKDVLVYGAVTRARSNLYFIETCLDCFHKSNTDPVYSRSLLILLSYSVELIFESYNILQSKETAKDKLVREIYKGHNLEMMCKKIIEDKQNFIGLKKCVKKQKKNFVEYVIDTDEGQVIAQDLKDIRYDFINYELRDIDLEEANKLRKYVSILFKLVNRILQKLPKLPI